MNPSRDFLFRVLQREPQNIEISIYVITYKVLIGQRQNSLRSMGNQENMLTHDMQEKMLSFNHLALQKSK